MTARYSATSASYSCICRTDMGFDQAPQDGRCVASAATAIVSSRVPNPYVINFRDVVTASGTTTSISVRSDAFLSLYMGSTTGCEFGWNTTACEALSNLCTLQHYDTTASACVYYLRIIQQRAQLASDTSQTLQALPSLYYSLTGTDPATAASQVVDLNAAVTPESGVSTLPLVLAAYSLNGTFLGLQEVAAQLQNCASSPIDQLTSWLSIAHDYDTSCAVNLSPLLDNSPPIVFYDIYIKDASDTLVPIPVRVINYRSGGKQPNADVDPWDFSTSALFRRFFIVDAVSGIESGSLRVVRIASDMRFWIRKAFDGRIYVPILDIAYTERDASSVSVSDASSVSSPTVRFRAQYIAQLDRFWRVVTALFSIACIVGGLLSLARARSWSARNAGPGDGWDLQFIGRCFLILCEVLAPLLFILLLAFCAYFFFAFHTQTTLKVLLPFAARDITLYRAALLSILACFGLTILRKLHQQCTIDVFLIDWEQSKGRLTRADTPTSPPRLAPVSVWRSVFLANEWEELQTYRRVNVEISLLAMYFVFEGLSVRYAAVARPSWTDLAPGKESTVMLFAIEAMMWLALAGVQMLFRALIYDRYYKSKLYNFVDVLSMANLSLVAFDELCHGYYVHGQSIHPCADTNVGELNAYLRREKADLVPRRGLNDTDQQCFEMYAQKEMRAAFNKVYGIVIAEIESHVAGSVAARIQRMSPEKQLRRFGGVDEARVCAYETVNHFLKSFFDRNLKEFQYMVRERSTLERVLANTPDVSHSSALFHDPDSFTTLLLYGIEVHLLLFYALVYSAVSQSTGSTGAAALVTCAMDAAIRAGRRHFGARNLSKKMMMDPKFLI
ncbi:Meckelin [Geranomyces variabilis]|nr:Meckelin [Geranomyces variabilis]